MVVVLENREDSDVLGSADAPYLNQLARRYGLAADSYAQSHPSLPNYLTLIGGQTFGIASDCDSCSVHGPNLVDQLEAAGIGWRAYMEGVPGPCYRGDSTDQGYAKKHDPFMYFPQIADSPARCGRVVPLSGLAADLAGAAPPFLWVTPDLCHDGHDCSTATMDRWMSGFLPSVLASPWFGADGAVIVTFDEGSSSAGCCRYATGGRLYTVVVSAAARPGARSDQPVDHAGTLGTIEDVYGLSRLGLAACLCSGSLTGLL